MEVKGFMLSLPTNGLSLEGTLVPTFGECPTVSRACLFLPPPLQVEPSRDSAQGGGDTAEIGSDKALLQPGSLQVKVPTSLQSKKPALDHEPFSVS